MKEIIETLAILATGGWAYWKFILQRQREPATDIDIDLRFLGIQDSKWIIEVTSILNNKSLVRHRYRCFQVTVRYLLPDDKIEDGDKTIHYQLKAPRSIDERIGGAKRYFANVDYLNPKQEFKHRYITAVPAQARFVWVQCKFLFTITWCKFFFKKTVKMNTQKIFRVPASEETHPTAP